MHSHYRQQEEIEYWVICLLLCSCFASLIDGVMIKRDLLKLYVKLRPWTNGTFLATKHHQTLFGDQTC